MELVGASEAAAILGVEVQRISRYRANGVMPPVVAELAATPVWTAGDVRAIHQRGSHEPAPPMDLAGTSEAANILGVDKSQIGRWRRRGVFPEPAWRLAATPVWETAAILDFASTRV